MYQIMDGSLMLFNRLEKGFFRGLIVWTCLEEGSKTLHPQKPSGLEYYLILLTLVSPILRIAKSVA